MKKHKLYIIALTLILLTSCTGNDVRKSLGLNKSAPDEFMVLSHPPLSVPPEFRLTPPDSQEAKKSEIRDQAKEALFSKAKDLSPSSPKSKGETFLLKQAKTSDANPDIRQILESETPKPEQAEEEEGFFDAITNQFTPAEAEDPLVDIEKEEERIAKNIKEGKPINEGEVPTQGGENGQEGIINEWLGF